MSDFEINQRVVDQIRKAGGSNGKHFEPGEFVALLDGKVVAVAKDLANTLKDLRALEPNPQRGMIFEAGPEIVDVIRR
jgi:Family of unknown function (DUF5678)